MLVVTAKAQEAQVTEDVILLETYPYDDPSPIPLLHSKPEIYPYHQYDGYQLTSMPQEWKVVTLENEWIQVMILPEVGGKVWGAIDKTTGKEFIYKNEVIKFRNIATRGPWTSGGIEFNFGVIGHHPSTASPVDYSYGHDADGGAYCIVGSIDLPSRTQWRVKIVLPKDKAYFETRASWYNPTTVRQAYYNWMTAAAPATHDLEIYAPGDTYLEHGGAAHPYPMDEKGRNLSLYKENNFGPSKSYHIVGAYEDYFGGYYKDKGYGFGHWSTYEDSPGQKIWLWALSRAGGIWEDLLTDTDGQYIEFQAGRLLNQYSPDDKQINPITKASFAPGAFDGWREIWFPINNVGGITDASQAGVMYIHDKAPNLELAFHSFGDQQISIQSINASGERLSEDMQVKAMQPIHHTLALSTVEVHIPQLDLHWHRGDTSSQIDRDFGASFSDSLVSQSNAYTFFRAEQAYVSRHYEQAERLYLQTLSQDILYLDAHVSLAELYYREAKYDLATEHLRQALLIDTYHGRANYLMGLLYKEAKDYNNAMESLAWATRDGRYASIAYQAMSEIMLAQKKYKRADEYCRKSLRAYPSNVQSLMLLASIQRLASTGGTNSGSPSATLLALDPLHHGAHIEGALNSGEAISGDLFSELFRGEYADQTLMEYIIYYDEINRREDALQVIRMMSEPSVMVSLWEAYLRDDRLALEALSQRSSALVFPFRAASIKVLDWAIQHHPSWKYKYYRSLLLIGLRQDSGKEALRLIGDKADDAIFYLSRAALLRGSADYEPLADLEKAKTLSSSWRVGHARSQYFMEQGMYREAQQVAEASIQLYPDSYILRMDIITALLHLRDYEEAIEHIAKTKVLPYEGASAGRILYEVAYTGSALKAIASEDYHRAITQLHKALTWDEGMGVGKPYDVDERLQDYLLSYCYGALGDHSSADTFRGKIVDYTVSHPTSHSERALLGLKTIYNSEDKTLYHDIIRDHQEWKTIVEQGKDLLDNELLSGLISEALQLQIQLEKGN